MAPTPIDILVMPQAANTAKGHFVPRLSQFIF